MKISSSVFKQSLTALLLLSLFLGSCGIFKKKASTSTPSEVGVPVRQESNVQDLKGYKNGMVVTAHPIASEVGLQILKKGGNAVDAAVAVQFALAVVYPGAGNIGGGGFMVYRSARGEINTLDFREAAPLAATTNMYLDMHEQPIGDLSLQGRLASGVPGSVDGMVKAHEKYGKLGWKELLQPAINLARDGFSITSSQASELNSKASLFLEYNPEGASFTSKSSWKAGDVLIQQDLAKTLELIRDNGRAGFYEGEVAEKIVVEMKRGNGIISLADLNSYEAKWRPPVIGSYRGYRIISMPPPSSGGIALIQLLQSVEEFPLRDWGFQRDSSVQVMIEAERRVYADRSTHLGDPDFYQVPQNELINPKYNAIRMSDMNFVRATPSTSIKAGAAGNRESEETTHFSI